MEMLCCDWLSGNCGVHRHVKVSRRAFEMFIHWHCGRSGFQKDDVVGLQKTRVQISERQQREKKIKP